MAGSQTHGLRQTQQWTVVPVSHRITSACRQAIFSWLRTVTARAISGSGGKIRTDGHSKKAAATPKNEPPQPFFRNKKPQNPYLQILVFDTFEQFF